MVIDPKLVVVFLLLLGTFQPRAAFALLAGWFVYHNWYMFFV
jgi:hypothetical protein